MLVNAFTAMKKINVTRKRNTFIHACMVGTSGGFCVLHSVSRLCFSDGGAEKERSFLLFEKRNIQQRSSLSSSAPFTLFRKGLLLFLFLPGTIPTLPTMSSRPVRRKKPQPHPEDLSFRSHSSVVLFRQLSDAINPDGTVYQVKTKNIDLEDDNLKRELPQTSRISSFTIDATLPMAQDNDRFFLRFFPFSEETDMNKKVFAKEPSSEVGFFGWVWRFFVRLFMVITLDPINRLYFARGLQDSLPYQAPHESLVLSTLIRELDKVDADGGSNNNKSRIWISLRLAFKNRNTSRILMQNFVGIRFDKLWHWHTQIRWNRLFDFLSNLPFLGFFGFSATENFPSSKNHAIRAIVRGFASGSWLTRFLTSNQEDLVTFGEAAAAQNLAAEGNGFEEANRNQYGTYFGRKKTNEFRLEHRLPTGKFSHP